MSTKPEVEDENYNLTLLVARLVRRCRKLEGETSLTQGATEYLKRINFQPNLLRDGNASP